MPPKKRGASAASTSAKTESSSLSSASSSAPSSASTKETCCVCCQTIHIGKDDALFCSGTCQHWLHRYCASVSVQCYKCIKDDDRPFYCFWCYQSRSQREIAALTSAVEELKLENAKLKESLCVTQSQVSAPRQDGPTQQSYASAVSKASHVPSTDVGSSMQTGQTRTASTNHLSERKYNVVVYGIEECSKGTLKHARLKSDLNQVVSVLSKVDATIDQQSIKDCYRLGKFSPNQNLPRPVLVKFIRISDVSNILSRKGDLSRPFSIKPDLSPEERHRDSLLLKERWRLIQSGTTRSEIKIRGSGLYLNKRLFARIVNSELQYTSALPSPVNVSQSVVPSDNTSLLPTNLDTSAIVPSNSSANVELPDTPSPITSDESSSTPRNMSHSTAHTQSLRNPSSPTPQSSTSNSD